MYPEKLASAWCYLDVTPGMKSQPQVEVLSVNFGRKDVEIYVLLKMWAKLLFETNGSALRPEMATRVNEIKSKAHTHSITHSQKRQLTQSQSQSSQAY